MKPPWILQQMLFQLQNTDYNLNVVRYFTESLNMLDYESFVFQAIKKTRKVFSKKNTHLGQEVVKQASSHACDRSGNLAEGSTCSGMHWMLLKSLVKGLKEEIYVCVIYT